jgi:MscS family membrane protein
MEEGHQKHEYLFSAGTVARAEKYFQRIRSEPYRAEGPPVSEGLYDWYVSVPGHSTVGAIVERLPQWMQRNRTFGLANWKWPGILLTVLFSIALMVVAYRSLWAFTERFRKTNLVLYCLTLVFPVGAMLVPLGARHFVEDYLTVRGQPLYVFAFLANLTAVLAAIVVIFSAANRIAASIIASPRINTQGLNAELIRISAKLGSLVAVAVLFVVGGQYLGIPVGTLLASAGIFGAAIALGAQDVLKNLFGSMVLLADKPFRVGDRIRFEEYDGFVEDIGLRSTRIRLLSGHLLSLPNDKLANNDVENVTNRAHIQRNATIHIPLDTPGDKVQKAVSIIRDHLANHEGMDPDHPPRVFFEEFDASAFSIRFFYWYSPPNRWDFKAFSERLNFAIFREFEENGIQFSLPFRHSFWKHDDEQGPLDVQFLENAGEAPKGVFEKS